MYIKKSMCLSMKDCMNVGIMRKSNGFFFQVQKKLLFQNFACGAISFFAV